MKIYSMKHYHSDMSVRTFDAYATKTEAIKAAKNLEHVGKKVYLAGSDKEGYVVAVYKE